MMKNLMRKSVFVIAFGVFVVLGFGIQSCTDDCMESELLLNAQTDSENQRKDGNCRSINEIIAISDSILDNKTRGVLSIKTMTPIVEGKDTVAYIINYPNNKGFTIISTYTAVPAVLAYSKENCFSMDNEPANLYFVNNIGKYTAEILNKSGGKPEVGNADDVVSYDIAPVIKIKLWQHGPFNKVVTKYHPLCPVGCGPVAGAMIMAYAKSSLQIGNAVYYFNKINKALIKGNPLDSLQIVDFNGSVDLQTIPTYTWPDTYAGAVDAMSNLLYRLGKPDLMNCIYDEAATSNTTDSALLTFKKTNYITSDLCYYNVRKMTEAINKRNLIFQHGTKLLDSINKDKIKEKGHFWVIDGCKYDYIVSQDSIHNCMFYCHWGWNNGNDDGYYLGQVLNPRPGFTYRLDNQFFVKIEVEEDDD